MKKLLPKYPRILGIAPSTRGFGFALLEGLNVLLDWGVKSVSGDKNVKSVANIEAMIVHYKPDVLVLEGILTKPFRRSERIRILSKRIAGIAAKHEINVMLFSREQVRQTFFADGQGTKYELAEILAKRFSEELGFRLPPKRRPWMSEDSRMNIFDAVALALTLRLRKQK